MGTELLTILLAESLWKTVVGRGCSGDKEGKTLRMDRKH